MLIKTINRNNQLINLFNQPIMGSEKVKMGDKVYYMLVDKLTKVSRHSNNDSNVYHKKCMNCGVRKSVNYFYTNNGSNDGYNGRCKSCSDSIHNNYNNISK